MHDYCGKPDAKKTAANSYLSLIIIITVVPCTVQTLKKDIDLSKQLDVLSPFKSIVPKSSFVKLEQALLNSISRALRVMFDGFCSWNFNYAFVDQVLAMSSRSWLSYSYQNRFHLTPLSYESLEYASGFSSEQCPEGIVAISSNTLRILALEKLGAVFNQVKRESI